MKASYIAVCSVLVLILLAYEAQVSMAVTCNPTELSSCVGAITSNTPPSKLCCSKIKEQKPCLCTTTVCSTTRPTSHPSRKLVDRVLTSNLAFGFEMEVGGDLDSKIESPLNVEKQMRLAGDVAGTKKAVTDILQLCFEARAWKTLNDQIVLLSKRRGQLKQAVTAMVQQVMLLGHE